ncbi:MAG TPA: acyl-CoA dehydrogenase family protein, partial [Burkholderiaceae bacterium]|nr:acyl-CoA dehydrogenase family protein [Burkholderiaceae bacterium]
MDLNIGPQYEAFRAEVLAFLAAHRDKAPAVSRPKDEKSKAWQRLLIEHGYAARTIPREYGGAGLEPDILKSRIIAEEFARARVSPGLGGQGISMLVPTLLEVG